MSHTEKIRLFVADMRSRGISAWTVAPPVYRLLWAIGFESRPPHFAGFTQLAISFGLFYCAFWGGIMWLFSWRETAMPPVVMITVSAVTGALFGLIMAWSIRRAARRLNLPEWKNYPLDPDARVPPAA
jgi:hypothetical protein